jgi:DNA replication licensing factor MCM3
VDAEGNTLELEQGLSIYKDYQTITLQEMPERAKVGQLPRSILLVLEYDLVDKVKPGDRIQCVGVYQPLSASSG